MGSPKALRPAVTAPRLLLVLLVAAALFLAATPAASGPLNQCLPFVCAEGSLNEGAPCRDDADCDLVVEGDGEGFCGLAPEPDPDRIFLVNDTADTLCDEENPETCCLPLDPEDPDPPEDPCAAPTCTLREAVIAANATENRVDDTNPDDPRSIPDIILLCPGTYELEIDGAGEDAAKSGDLDISEDLAIGGFNDTSFADTTISGGSDGAFTDRIFHLLPPPLESDPNLEAAIERLTLENGGGPGFDENGGAILVEGSMTLTRIILRDNEVGAADGGAIHVTPRAQLSFTVTGIVDNVSGRDGGGISSEGGFTGDTSTLSGNTAADRGGAIYSLSKAVVSSRLVGSTVSENDAPGGGDGVYNDSVIEGEPPDDEVIGLDFGLFNTLIVDDACATSGDVFITNGGGNLESPGSTCLMECVGGANDGDGCADDSDCPDSTDPEGTTGSCLFVAPVCVIADEDEGPAPTCDVGTDCVGFCEDNDGTCDGGANDGDACREHAACEGICDVPTAVCEGGENAGVVCTSDGDCPDSTCPLEPMQCIGGANDGTECTQGSECEGICENAPTCIDGADDGELCVEDSDCGGICQRGSSQGEIPLFDPDDPGRPVVLQERDDSGVPVYPLALGLALGQDEPKRNPAIDSGVDINCLNFDQRGVLRPQDGFFDGDTNCDVGAFEAQRPRAEKTATVVSDDGDGIPEPGETLEYTITLINDGELADADTPFDFADFLELDENATLVVGQDPPTTTTTTGTIASGNDPGDPDGDPPTAADSSVLIDCGTLTVGAAETITYQTLIDPDLSNEVGVIRNQGVVSFIPKDNEESPCDVPEPPVFPGSIDTDNPFTTVLEDITTVVLADPPSLLACKQDSLEVDLLDDGRFNPGDTIRYQIVITNEGLRPARNVLFEDDPHRDTDLVVGSVRVEIDDVDLSDSLVVSGNTEGDTRVEITLGDIPERATSTILVEFSAVIHDPIPIGCTDLLNFATLTGDNFEVFFSDDPGAPVTEIPPSPTRTEIDFSPLADDSVRFKVRLNFREVGADSFRLRMKNIEVPGGIEASDEVIVDIGDLRLTGVLDGDGRSEASDGTRRDRFRMKRRSRTVVVEDGDDIPVYKLLVRSKDGDFAETFAAFGLDDRNAKKEPLPVDTRVRIGKDCLLPDNECVDFRANVVVFYSAKAGKKGKGKASVPTVPFFECPLL